MNKILNVNLALSLDTILIISSPELKNEISSLSPSMQSDLMALLKEVAKAKAKGEDVNMDHIINMLSGCNTRAIEKRKRHWRHNIQPVCEQLLNRLKL